ALADHHTRTRRINGNAGILGRTLDDHAPHRGVLEFLLQVLAHADVFGQHAAEVLVVRVPAGSPVAVDREPEPDRMNFLSHDGSLGPDLDHNVASLLLDAVAPALGAG